MFAGVGGYNVTVGGTTSLVGAALASDADASRNVLDTGSLITKTLVILNCSISSAASTARTPKKNARRREALRRCLFGTAGLLLADGWGLHARAASRPSKAKSVIQIWMWGGPCHLDTFDPKPDAGRDYCGPFDKPLSTNVDGMRICAMLP